MPVLLRPYNASLPPWVSKSFGNSLMAVPLSSWLLQTLSEKVLDVGLVGLVKMLSVASFLSAFSMLLKLLKLPIRGSE